VRRFRAELTGRPFRAPEAQRLAELGLGPREVGTAVRAGALIRLGGAVLLPPEAVPDAVRVLAGLPQPFTLSAARQALDTTRRVAVPLLELLDRQGLTRRLPDDARLVVAAPAGSADPADRPPPRR
jgi:selenocysteine-specific elongation factor